MQADAFIQTVRKHFPTQRPNPSRLFEGIRSESGCEKLEFLVHVEWPDFTIDMMDVVAGEFWQMSSVWNKYFLPAFMCITAKYDLELETDPLKTGTFIEIKEEQESLTTCISSYWFSIHWFMTEELDITTNLYFGLTSKQVDLVEIWLNHIDFETLHEADVLYADLDYSTEACAAFIEKVRKFSI